MVPLKLFLIISDGPGLASDENTGALQKAASISTKPGSSQSDERINNFKLNGFILRDEKKINNKENPTIAPISLFIYSVQVLKTLNSSA